MGYSIIPLDSYTAARKASRYLAQRGISARIEKISSGRMGCRFGIRVSEPPDMVCGILAGAGIRCGGSMPVPPPPPPPPFPPRPPRPPRRGRR
ncbi:MAG: hypothetical protein K5876_06810 [Ruminiclostridium sp.]|nr:hypothetical protein [Ruminiclostridium sp.]